MNHTAHLANDILNELSKVEQNNDYMLTKIKASLISTELPSDPDLQQDISIKYTDDKLYKACELLEEEGCIKTKSNGFDFIGITYKGEEVIGSGGFIQYLRKFSKFSDFYKSVEANNSNAVSQEDLLSVIKDLVFTNTKLKQEVEIKEDQFKYSSKIIKEHEIADIASIKIDVPEELKLSLQQYILFFKEYLYKVKGVDAYFEVVKTSDGLRVDIKPNEVQDIVVFNDWFKEYLSLLKIESKNTIIDFYTQLEEKEAGIFMQELENQVEFTKKQIKINNIKANKNNVENRLMPKLNLTLPPERSYVFDKGYNDIEQFKLQMKYYISLGQTSKTLEELLLYFGSLKSDKYDDIILLNAKISRLEIEVRSGILKREDENLEKNKIEKNIIDFINSNL